MTGRVASCFRGPAGAIRPARIAIIGLGGYAVRHHEAVRDLETAGEVRLVCTCDPVLRQVAGKDAAWDLAARGIAIFDDYRRMFDAQAKNLDVVIIPTPIPLHEEMHAEAVGRGLAVYLEKPPTLDPDELERMIERDAAAPVPTLVGFNFTAEPARQALKARLLAGEFGRLREVRLHGLWPRGQAYYARNDWAGRLCSADGRLILDSCLGNGFAHHVHNLLHWAGLEGQDHWASPVSVRARLLRAHAIEGADTVFLSAETDTGVVLRLALSHACRGPEKHGETVVCDRARIEYVTRGSSVIVWRDGRIEPVATTSFDPQRENLRALLACRRGERSRPPVTLIDSRPFVHLHALAYISAGWIETFPEEEILPEAPDDRGGRFRPVRALEEQVEAFLAHEAWPGATPAGASPPDLPLLPAAVQRMASGTSAACSVEDQATP